MEASIGSHDIVTAGEDRFGEHRGLGISTIAFKVTPDRSRDLLVLENTFHARGGPPRHVHHAQDEWFYALEGEFAIEIGEQRLTLRPGDSVLGPRAVPPSGLASATDRGGSSSPSHRPA